MSPTPVRTGRRRVSIKIDEHGTLRVEVDGEVVSTIQFTVGCELVVNVDHLLMYKTTIGKRGNYGQRPR